jgi:hypothetical protein
MKTSHKKIIVFAAIPVGIFILIMLFFPLFTPLYFPKGFHGGVEEWSGSKGLISCLMYGKEKIDKESDGINGDYFCGYGCRWKQPEARTCDTGIAVHCINEGCEYYIPERGRYDYNFK